jgi:hypothetical protein
VRTRVPAAMYFLILLVLLLSFLAGCGGDGSGSSGGSQGDEQQGSQQQGGKQQGGQQQGGEATNAGAPREKVALGSIQSVDPDKRKIVMKPNFAAQGGDQITFNVRKNAEIRVNDQEADLSDIQTGKQAQISYVTKKDINRATSVEIVGDSG